MSKSKTTHTRVYRDTINDMKMKFPELDSKDLIKISWETSLLKMEGKLRSPSYILNAKKKKYKRR
jgi:hypothetical protein